jgi:hypothetical protein
MPSVWMRWTGKANGSVVSLCNALVDFRHGEISYNINIIVCCACTHVYMQGA